MKNKKEIIKIPIHFDLINEIIINSLVIILFGIAYLFAFNLLRVNIYTIFFGGLTLFLIYFKRSSFLKIKNNQLEIIYFKYYQANEINLNQIDQCIFYKENSLVEIKTKKQRTISVYLKDKNKEQFLNYLVNHCPEISAIFIEKN